MSYSSLESQLTSSLGLARRPVAVSYRDTAPAGVEQFNGTRPSGCSFWPLAAEGRTFYTVPADHYNCPIGSYTHNVPLPSDRAPELEQTLSLMGSIGYIKMEEIPGIYRLPKTPAVIVYSPLGDAPVDPDVIIFAGSPGRMMLLAEAALRAGVTAAPPLFARPTCMALPAALSQGMVSSTACIGNRVYTDMSEDELYVVVPGKDLARIAAESETIASANEKLAEYHRAKRQAQTA